MDDSGAALQEDHGTNDDDIDYVQLTQQETQGGKVRAGGGGQSGHSRASHGLTMGFPRPDTCCFSQWLMMSTVL